MLSNLLNSIRGVVQLGREAFDHRPAADVKKALAENAGGEHVECRTGQFRAGHVADERAQAAEDRLGHLAHDQIERRGRAHHFLRDDLHVPRRAGGIEQAAHEREDEAA